MRRTLSTLILSAGLAFSLPAIAKSSKSFENSLSTPVDSVRVEVILSKDLEWRANNLPEKLSDRGSSRRLNDGWGGNGFYGEKDLDRLVSRLDKTLTKRLEKEGVRVDDASSNVIRITLTDVKPNRPTFAQLSKNASLSQRSFGIGGASFEGQLLTNNGEASGDISYAWYETDIRDAQYGGTWSDTHRAIDRFSRHTAKSLKWK